MTLLRVSERGPVSGIFYDNSKTQSRDIRDGLSNTILLGERSKDLFDSFWSGAAGPHLGWRVVGWTSEPPNHPEHSVTVHFHGYAQFNSMHPGVTSFAFCDGSTRVIPDTIDRIVFASLGSRNGRELLAAEY